MATTNIGILFTSFLLLACNTRQNNDASSINFLKQGYNKNTLYVYAVCIYDSTEVKTRDTLGLFCSDVKMMNGQYMMQWEAIQKTEKGYQLASNAPSSLTGILVSDTELYIHPPREGIYRVLQFCPHPLLHQANQASPTTKHWTQELTIGNLWSTEPIFIIDSGTTETFTSKYSVVDTNISDRFSVNALTISKYGITTAKYQYADDSGIVYFKMYPSADMRYEFTLIDIVAGIEGMRFNENFTWQIERKRQARKSLPFHIGNELN